MINFLRSFWSKDMAIDLGTANTIVYLEGQGIALNEPSVVALEIDGTQKRLKDVGHGAKSMLGRTPSNISVVRPMRDGVIADYKITEQMLNHFIRKVHGTSIFTPGPRIVICVPTSATPVDRRAIRESALAAGAVKVHLIDEPMAAAIGCKLPVHDASGSMVLDIGGGTAEIGIISLGGLVYSKSVPIGGDRIDASILEFIRKEFGIAIGESTAEKIKKQVALAHLSLIEKENKEATVSGHHVAEGVPRQFVVTSEHIYRAIEPVLKEITQAVRVALENVPPELSSDISQLGIALTGGGALIEGLDLLLRDEIGVPITKAQDPLTCVARGCGEALQYIDDPRRSSVLSS